MNMNLQGYSGLMMVTGAEGDPPTAISNSWNDYIGGLHACFAILQAIDERRKSDQGRLIDLSQFECSAAMIGSLLLSSAVNRTVPSRHGNRSDRHAPQGVYACDGTDNWCSLCAETDDQWNTLTRLIGQEHWGSDRRFRTAADRLQNHDEIDQAISAWTRQHSSKEVEDRLRAVGISADRVRRINDVIDSADSGTAFSRIAERRVGSMLTTTLPFSLSSVTLPAPHSAPSLGEHGVEVLREWLKCSEAEIAELRRREVLQ
jgi:crotonobetainyl-CoA:carnitine CoA-transferase CaiB-like acyl-CoA transferase